MVQEMIADSWLEMEMFRLLVLRTAWRIDRYQDYKRVRKDISGVKAAMPGCTEISLPGRYKFMVRWVCHGKCPSPKK